jgi:hypothetical protein
LYSVTGIGAAKIYLSYRDRLYTLYDPDWTYPIDYCINHIENNVAIIVANIPILRGLVTRWVFDFRGTKAAPTDRKDRPVPLRKRSNLSEKAYRKVHRNHMMRRLLPCIDDFSSSLATPEQSKQRPGHSLGSGTFTTLSRHTNRKLSTYLSRSPRSSADCYDSADACEKANVRGTVTSIGSAPTLIGSALESANRNSRQWESAALHAKRSSPTLRPTEPFGTMRPLSEIQPLEQVRLTSALDGEEFDFGEEMWPYHNR